MKDNRSTILKLLIALVVIILFCLFLNYENTHIVITEYVYQHELITEDMNGFCIVQISDLHNAVFGKNNSKLISKIKECNPDIIVLTGDFVDGSTHTNIKKALDFAQKITELCPVYYITGNHEYYLSENNRNELLSGLESTGVIIINNSQIALSERINLTGLDDNSLSTNTLQEYTSAANLDIVLAHEPQYIKRYSANGADLVLSGHAHGGQFRLPIIGAVFAPDQGINPEYTEGIYTQGNMKMIVSRGLGNSAFPFRLFNDPEIVCIRLSM